MSGSKRNIDSSAESSELYIVKKPIKSSWIILAKDTLLENRELHIVNLPHPSLGKSAKYCLDHISRTVYQVVIFNEAYRGWFVGETVKSDASISILTPVNPVFLVLPHLRNQCNNRAIPLTDLVAEHGLDKILDYLGNLNSVADLKGPPELKAYKYNEDKTLTWLQNKVTKLAKVLKEKNIHVTSGAVSATFVASNVQSLSIDEEFYLQYAHGLISEYLEDDLVVKLEKKFNFNPNLIESLGKKRKSELRESINKKIKCEKDVSKELGHTLHVDSDVKMQKPLTAKEKARKKAATGTNTLSAFFLKK